MQVFPEGSAATSGTSAIASGHTISLLWTSDVIRPPQNSEGSADSTNVALFTYLWVKFKMTCSFFVCSMLPILHNIWQAEQLKVFKKKKDEIVQK